MRVIRQLDLLRGQDQLRGGSLLLYFSFATNPIRLVGGTSFGCISSRMASKTFSMVVSCSKYFLSSRSSLASSSLLVVSISRILSTARMMELFMLIYRLLLITL